MATEYCTLLHLFVRGRITGGKSRTEFIVAVRILEGVRILNKVFNIRHIEELGNSYFMLAERQQIKNFVYRTIVRKALPKECRIQTLLVPRQQNNVRSAVVPTTIVSGSAIFAGIGIIPPVSIYRRTMSIRNSCVHRANH